MTTLLVGNRSPSGVSSDRLAYATNAMGQHITSAAAYARWLAEYVNGTTVTDYGNPPQVAPPTPMFGDRNPGHDHTGGMMGVPQKHTVWQHAWGWPDDTGIEDGEAPLADSSVGGVSNRIIDGHVGAAWCPPGYVYQVGCLCEVIVRLVGTTATINVRMEVNGLPTENTSFSASTGINVITLPRLAPMRPGWNRVALKVEVTAWAGSGSAHLVWAGIHQIHDTPVPAVTP